MQRIHIVGRKNSGKTTLIVELVGQLSSLGHRVGTVKHTHHRHELDTPGKDSHRHRAAGAAAVGILSPDLNAVFWPPRPDETVSARYDDLLTLFAGCDLVLVEGHSQADRPKVEVWRAATDTEPMAASDESIRAVVTDDPLELAVPIWRRSDVPALAERLLEMRDA